MLLGTVQIGLSVKALGSDSLRVRDLTPVTIHAAPQHPPVAIVRDGSPQAKVYAADAKPSRTWRSC